MEFNFLILFIFIGINLIFIYFFDNIKIFHQNIDKPDSKRKIHKKPIPLAGGTIIFINIVFYFFLIFLSEGFLSNEILFKGNFELIIFFLSCSAIFALGFLDDRFNISASKKFLIISILILLVLFLDDSLIINKVRFSFLSREFGLSYLSIIFTCFCFLVFLNSFNMFDGINLQSCLYSITIFTSILIFYSDLILIKVFLICLIAYSYLNFKNKSFLGDSGSLLIPFVIGYIFIKLYNNDIIYYADEIVIFMLIPGLDLIRLFFKRILQKRNPLHPDRFHLHHLLISKFSHTKTLFMIMILILLPILFNFLSFQKIVIIILTSIIYIIIIKKISKKKL